MGAEVVWFAESNFQDKSWDQLSEAIEPPSLSWSGHRAPYFRADIIGCSNTGDHKMAPVEMAMFSILCKILTINTISKIVNSYVFHKPPINCNTFIRPLYNTYWVSYTFLVTFRVFGGQKHFVKKKLVTWLCSGFGLYRLYAILFSPDI